MMKAASKWLCTVAAAAFATCSWADIPLPNGWYLEGNVGVSPSGNGDYGPGIKTSGSGAGFNANGGFRFMPYFALEVGYTKYAGSEGKYNGTQVVADTRYSYDVAGKGILPLNDTGVELFAKLGVARMSSKVTERNNAFVTANNVSVDTGTHTDTGYYFGLGGDYNFTPNLAANLQWQRAKGDSRIGNLDLYSLGMTYTFS